MAWAMAIPAVASAVSGIAGQAMGNAASREQVEKAEAVLRGMKDLDLTGMPDYSFIDYAGDYNPYAYTTPEAAQYQTIGEDPQTRAIQMEALQRLIANADGAHTARQVAERFAALDDANRVAQSREGAIRNQMERKGQGGTGVNALMQAQAAQMGANRARAGTLDAVSKAALERLAASTQAMQAASQLRGQDFQRAAANANAINEFNLFNTRAMNDVAQRNVDMQNSAQLRNLNTKQDLGGRNTGIANNNIDRRTNNIMAMNAARNERLKAQGNAAMGHANMLQQQAPTWNQMGQQGAQLFTNIGAGITAAQNANPPKGYLYQKNDEGFQRSDDGSFTSQWW